MRYLLDTTWIVEYLRGNPEIISRIQQHQQEGLAVSIVSVAELYEGVFRSSDPARNEDSLKGFLSAVTVLEVSEEVTTRRSHPRIAAALRSLREADLAACCQERPPALFKQGVGEFNGGMFFEQHETFETLWRAESRPLRFLYQGILQLGVGFLHLRRGKLHGAAVKLENGLALLEAFEPACLGIDVARLRREASACLEVVRELGTERLDQFDWTLVPRLRPVT